MLKSYKVFYTVLSKQPDLDLDPASIPASLLRMGLALSLVLSLSLYVSPFWYECRCFLVMVHM